MYEELVSFIRELYRTREFIPLHEPRFFGNEKQYLMDTIDSTFVSSVGKYVDDFEAAVAEYTGSSYAIATVNGTAALHAALLLAGVQSGDEVITQSFTFVATANAIRACNASPVFVDISADTLGLSAESLGAFLEEKCELREDGNCWNRQTGNIVRACVPMHSFGFPVELNEIAQICNSYNVALVEDAAESLGSFYHGQHTGTMSQISALSFNGNKIITTGGGGMLLTNDQTIAKRAKHITTTAKIKHKWEFNHDEAGYNYRLPNLNAALGLAQMESLPEILSGKRIIASRYLEWGRKNGVRIVSEPSQTSANYWLNTIITESIAERDKMLEYTNSQKVMTRPAWTPMHRLPMYKGCQQMPLINTEWFQQRIVNLPSSLPLQH